MWKKNVFVYFADEEPPSHGNTCPQDIKKYTENNDDVYVTWEAPKFTDNSGESITVKITGQSGSSKYSVGTTLITYSATDTAGLTTKCSFSIKIISEYPLYRSHLSHDSSVVGDFACIFYTLYFVTLCCTVLYYIILY